MRTPIKKSYMICREFSDVFILTVLHGFMGCCNGTVSYCEILVSKAILGCLFDAFWTSNRLGGPPASGQPMNIFQIVKLSSYVRFSQKIDFGRLSVEILICAPDRLGNRIKRQNKSNCHF